MSDESKTPFSEQDELTHPDREAGERDEHLHGLQRSHQAERVAAVDELSQGHRRVLREASQEIRELVRDTLVELEPSSAARAPADGEELLLQAKLGRIVATRHQRLLDTPEAHSLLARITELEASLYGQVRRAEDAIRASESESLLDALRGSLSGRLGSAPSPRRDRTSKDPELFAPSQDPGEVEEALERSFAELGLLSLDHPQLREVDDPSVTELIASLRSMRQHTPTRVAARLGEASPTTSPESMRLLKHRASRARDVLVLLDDELQERLSKARDAERAFLDEVFEAEKRLEAVRLRSYDREEELRPGRIELVERLEAAERTRRETLEMEARRARETSGPDTRTREERQREQEQSAGARERAEMRARRHVEEQVRRKLTGYLVLGALGLSLLAFTSFYLAGGFGMLRSVATGERAIQFEDGTLRLIDRPPPSEE